MKEACDRYCEYLQALTAGSLDRLGEFVAEDVRFADPFNDVRGRGAMERVFRHMFNAVGPVSFTVTHASCAGETCVLAWRFEARLRGRPWKFDGASRLRFNADGKVVEHVDHWDAARAFYERLPVIGWLLSAIRRRLRVE